MTVLRLQAIAIEIVARRRARQPTDDLVRGLFDFAASLQAATDATWS